VFLRMMEGLAAADAQPKTIMINATYLKAHREALAIDVDLGDQGRAGGRGDGTDLVDPRSAQDHSRE
jgi:hypothetical protein